MTSKKKENLIYNSEIRKIGNKEIKGQELISVIKENFGEDKTLILEDFECIGHNIEGDKILYKYNQETAFYVDNPNHLGHGGNTDPNEPVIHTNKNKMTITNNQIIYTIDLYYTEQKCSGDICSGVVDKEKIYKTYDDLKEQFNSCTVIFEKIGKTLIFKNVKMQ